MSKIKKVEILGNIQSKITYEQLTDEGNSSAYKITFDGNQWGYTKCFANDRTDVFSFTFYGDWEKSEFFSGMAEISKMIHEDKK